MDKHKAGLIPKPDNSSTANSTAPSHIGTAKQPGKPWSRVLLAGVPIDALTMQQAVAYLGHSIAYYRLQRRQEFESAGELQQTSWEMKPSVHVVTINPEIGWAAQEDAPLKRAICEAGLVVPDGIGVVLAGRLKGERMPERVAGFDLMQHLLLVAADKGYSVFFLGAAPGVAEEAIATAVQRHPTLQVVGCADGYFKDEDEAALVQRINEARPDMLFCALGPPRPAETWINRLLPKLDVALAMGVGGSFNVMAGRVLRAPQWMQAMGLEWLYRTLREPKRIGRLRAIPLFMWRVWRS